MTASIDELTIMLAGEAGAGVQSTETILTSIMKKTGYNVFATKEYMSRVRGGTNSTTIRISARRVCNQFSSPDIFIPFDLAAYNRYKDEMPEKTIVITDTKIIQGSKIFHLGFNEISLSIGNII